MRSVFVIVGFLCASISWAQGHRIEFKINNYNQEKCFIAYYYGDNNYILDTLDQTENGLFIMEGPNVLEKGVYTLATNELMPMIEFLVYEQRFSLTTDVSDYLGNLVVTGSKENEIFRDYRLNLTKLQKQVIPIRKRLDSLSTESPKRKHAEDSLKIIEDQFSSYKKELFEKNENGFWASIAKAQENPVVPDFPKLEGGLRDSLAEYHWLKDHYFDYIDFGDLRYLHSPVLNQRVSRYLNVMVIQSPDSIINEIDYLIAKSKAHPEIFKFMCITLFKWIKASNVMGMDAAYVHLVRKYYTDDSITWMDAEGLKELRDHVEVTSYLLLGKKAPNLELLDAEGKWHKLHDFQAQFTILLFWDSQCHTCQEVTTKMSELYPKWKSKGIDVFGVSTEVENDAWIAYQKEKALPWLNVSDNTHDTFKQNLRESYDIFDTPVIYVLDQDKNILIKKLEFNNLVEYIKVVLLKENE